MLNLGDTAPEFSLPGTDQNTYDLSGLKGDKATAVIFSCNHCPYVKAYEDRMIGTANEFRGRGVNFVVINANDPGKYPDDDFVSMIARAEEKNYPFPYLQDESQEIARAYGAERTPEVFVFDGELKLQYHGAIDDNYEDPANVSVEYLKKALSSLVAGQEVEVKESQAVGCTIKWK